MIVLSYYHICREKTKKEKKKIDGQSGGWGTLNMEKYICRKNLKLFFWFFFVWFGLLYFILSLLVVGHYWCMVEREVFNSLHGNLNCNRCVIMIFVYN